MRSLSFFQQQRSFSTLHIDTHKTMIYLYKRSISINVFTFIPITGIKRQAGFLTAAVSMRKKIIGTVSRAMGSIAVERPQDLKFKGAGSITVSDVKVSGVGSIFTKELTAGATIVIDKQNLLVASVESDTACTLKKASAIPVDTATEYKIIPKVDQDQVMETVAEKLVSGEAIGIFPEGGSHDRTDLLPLKAGVTIMALTALTRNPNLPLKIIPCGLNYFHGHRFRSEAYLDIGEAIVVPADLITKYAINKRDACNELLDLIKGNLLLYFIPTNSLFSCCCVHLETKRTFQAFPTLAASHALTYRIFLSFYFDVAL
jgi:glycerol-3-phosphate O-acyltransferase/dihydroxyacetone phosphate acyltransferase